MVAPTWELNIETYGYGKKRKTYDPDYEHVESAKFKEFERLEAQGYDDELKDPDHDKIRKVRCPFTLHRLNSFFDISLRILYILCNVVLICAQQKPTGTWPGIEARTREQGGRQEEVRARRLHHPAEGAANVHGQAEGPGKGNLIT